MDSIYIYIGGGTGLRKVFSLQTSPNQDFRLKYLYKSRIDLSKKQSKTFLSVETSATL